MAAEFVEAVCESARQDPAGPATARAVTATRQAIGFTGFMEDNSTYRAAPKILFAAQRVPSNSGPDPPGSLAGASPDTPRSTSYRE